MFFSKFFQVIRNKIVIFLLFYLFFTILFFFLDPSYSEVHSYLQLIAQKNGKIALFIYPLCYLCMSCIGTLLLLAQSKLIRIFSFIFMFVSLGIFMAYRSINAYGYYLDEAVDMIHWAGQYAEDAFSMFYDRFIGSTAIAIAITALIIFASRYAPKIKTKIVLPCIGILGIFIAICGNILYLAFLSPIYFKIPLISYLAVFSPYYNGARNQVSIQSVNAKKFPKIFLVVDESIRGDHLSINNPKVESTPFLKTLNLFNWGVCCAAGNTSAISNLALQTGLKIEQVPDYSQQALHQSNIFQYAKVAGYKTVFIEGQNGSDMPVNFMLSSDFQHIDEYIQILKENPSPVEIDHLIAKKMVEISQDSTPTFVYVNKIGCHFHYENRYPQDKKYLQPTLTSVEWCNDEQRIYNSYHNAIRWTVDEFFHIFYNGAKDTNFLLFYTSDHGQSFFEHNIPSPTNIVCNPPISQANTPLFVLATQESYSNFSHLVKKRCEEDHNNVSQFQIFSSILHCMGYSLEDLTQYEQTLFIPQQKNLKFISGNAFGIGVYYINSWKIK